MNKTPVFQATPFVRQYWKAIGLGCLGGVVACIVAILAIGLVLSSGSDDNVIDSSLAVVDPEQDESNGAADGVEPGAAPLSSVKDKDIRHAILGRWKRIEHNLFGYVDTDDTNCAYGVIQEFKPKRFDDIDLLIEMKKASEGSGRSMPDAYINHDSFGVSLPDGRTLKYTLWADGTLLLETTGVNNPRGPSSPYAIFSRCKN